MLWVVRGPSLRQHQILTYMDGPHAVRVDRTEPCIIYSLDYIRFFHLHIIKYYLLDMLKIKRDINQQDLKMVDFHFVPFE